MSEQQFTWLPFFNEMLMKICTEYNSQTLAKVFNEIFPGQQDENPKNNKIPFQEVDPLTFIACFNRNIAPNNRIELCKQAKEIMNLQAPLPSDFMGIPCFSNFATWFVRYTYKREKDDISLLWAFAQKRLKAQEIEEKEIETLVKLPFIGITKISQFLFICFPKIYYPMDANTCSFLGIQRETSFSCFKQVQQIAKQKCPSQFPYQISFQAWKDKRETLEDSTSIYEPSFWVVRSNWEGKDQSERFITQNCWENGYGKSGMDKHRNTLNRVAIGDIFILLSTKNTAIGKVTKRINWWSFQVNWEKREIENYLFNGHNATISKVMGPEQMDYAKKLLLGSNDRSVYYSSKEPLSLNQILFGPPGTGKTYHTIIKAVEIINKRLFSQEDKTEENYKNNILPEFNKLKQEGKIKFITFHQNYSYEDFMVGIRPVLNGTNIAYELHEGPFKQIADKAREDYKKNKASASNYVLIIDEINRGNISKIFGELITLIEDDKREDNKHALSVPLMYHKDGEDEFSVPKNLYIIGTMNTADKSIALVDIALRRRFVFKEMIPEKKLLKPIEGFDLPGWFSKLNQKITIELDRDHQIGHSYFMEVTNKVELKQKFYQCILPLLKEYFYGNPEKLKEIIPGFEQEKQLEDKDFISALEKTLHDKTDNNPGMEEN